jgi:transposase-like protein
VKKVYPKPAAVAKPSREEFLATLEALCREKVGEVIQAVLEAEVDEFLGRLRGQREGARPGYRDGHDEQRTVTYGSHSIAVRRPRVRASEERFVSRVLPPYRRRFEAVDKTLHELWVQGLSTRDFEPSLRAILGEQTPLSPSTISRVNKQFHDEYATWCARAIANEFVYVWADGVYLGAGPTDERRVMLVVIGVDVKGQEGVAGDRGRIRRKRGELDERLRELAQTWPGGPCDAGR